MDFLKKWLFKFPLAGLRQTETKEYEVQKVQKEVKVCWEELTWRKVGLQIILCLSTAMAMMVSEDMKMAKQGNTFTSLQEWDFLWNQFIKKNVGWRMLRAWEVLVWVPAGQERGGGEGPVVPESVQSCAGQSQGGNQVTGGQVEDQDVPVKSLSLSYYMRGNQQL